MINIYETGNSYACNGNTTITTLFSECSIKKMLPTSTNPLDGDALLMKDNVLIKALELQQQFISSI